MRAYLRDGGLLDDAAEERIAAAAEATATVLRDGMNAEVRIDPQDLFRYVYTTPTPQLVEQSARLADELSREEDTK
jgi:pyruvate dehydrogenase E1 component alpha subunit